MAVSAANQNRVEGYYGSSDRRVSKQPIKGGRRRFGAHTSIAGSLENSAVEASELGCTAFQIFSHSPRIWRAAPLESSEIEQLRRLRQRHDLAPLVIHGSYLLNLAAADQENRRKSIAGFREEVERALAIGAEYLVIHPGSAKGHDDRDAAIEALADAFAESAKGVRWRGLELLLENTAGGGASLGRTFGELSAIRRAIHRRKRAARVGYCLDTCHLYAAGYDISTVAGLRSVVREAERELGLERVRVVHFNDSKTKLGSRLDRHARIGEGHIGREALRRVINHPKLRSKAFILETPHDAEGTHRESIESLKSLIQAP